MASSDGKCIRNRIVEWTREEEKNQTKAEIKGSTTSTRRCQTGEWQKAAPLYLAHRSLWEKNRFESNRVRAISQHKKRDRKIQEANVNVHSNKK